MYNISFVFIFVFYDLWNIKCTYMTFSYSIKNNLFIFSISNYSAKLAYCCILYTNGPEACKDESILEVSQFLWSLNRTQFQSIKMESSYNTNLATILISLVMQNCKANKRSILGRQWITKNLMNHSKFSDEWVIVLSLKCNQRT